ncbi:meiotically up-regulated gene 113-domain-containing protein [Elsinoe ampelina]|uniref:Meiotically up-regulated gene 113-domain-containing protein n=1 Tax=Elsinoe ampelina TaxID=302913 RepID=A0A6A6GQX3_9PEZI|nr:meiotically up-regulated gene 113-domain-containing protein [Elsinoe ampelina]
MPPHSDVLDALHESMSSDIARVANRCRGADNGDRCVGIKLPWSLYCFDHQPADAPYECMSALTDFDFNIIMSCFRSRAQNGQAKDGPSSAAHSNHLQDGPGGSSSAFDSDASKARPPSISRRSEVPTHSDSDNEPIMSTTNTVEDDDDGLISLRRAGKRRRLSTTPEPTSRRPREALPGPGSTLKSPIVISSDESQNAAERSMLVQSNMPTTPREIPRVRFESPPAQYLTPDTTPFKSGKASGSSSTPFPNTFNIRFTATKPEVEDSIKVIRENLPNHLDRTKTIDFLVNLILPRPLPKSGYIYVFKVDHSKTDRVSLRPSPQSSSSTNKEPGETSLSVICHSHEGGEDLLYDVLNFGESKERIRENTFGTPRQANEKFIRLKIGRATDVHARMDGWMSECEHDCLTFVSYPTTHSIKDRSWHTATPLSKKFSGKSEWYDREKTPFGERELVPDTHRAERLIHLILQNKKARVGQCGVCDRVHNEWFDFEVSKEAAEKLDAQIWRCIDLVKRTCD